MRSLTGPVSPYDRETPVHVCTSIERYPHNANLVDQSFNLRPFGANLNEWTGPTLQVEREFEFPIRFCPHCGANLLIEAAERGVVPVGAGSYSR